MYAGSNGKAAVAAADAWPSEFAETRESAAVALLDALSNGAPPTAGVSI